MHVSDPDTPELTLVVDAIKGRDLTASLSPAPFLELPLPGLFGPGALLACADAGLLAPADEGLPPSAHEGLLPPEPGLAFAG